MEKYGTYKILECSQCHNIIHVTPTETIPQCACVEQKLAHARTLHETDPERVVYMTSWIHRSDLEEKDHE